jgi:3',5'-cyclic AMP phosphodiesterase CpdA
MKKYFPIFLILGLLTGLYGQNCSFAVVTDPRLWKKTFQNALIEIRDRTVDPKSQFPPAEFIVICGDLSLPVNRYRDYMRVFANDTSMNSFFPVRGNHDKSRDARKMIKKILPEQDSLTLKNTSAVDYFVDWKNVRLIIIDQYSNASTPGCLNNKQIEWIEELINTAHRADHVFIFFHEPAFPRYRHINNSFNLCRTERDEFWDMIMDYREKVKAVFVGHTHYYNRMKIATPRSPEANDATEFPQQENGIYQIDVGSCGQGKRNNIVRVQIEGKKIHLIAIEAKKGENKPFKKIDEWNIND